MTQAPTPGPLSGDDWDAIRAHPCYGEHQPGCDCVIPDQSLAPTAPVEDVSTKPPETNMSPEHVKETEKTEHVAAPVEASGSERWTEDMERERREADYEHGFRDGQNARETGIELSREMRLSAALIALIEHFERVDAGPEDKAAIQSACAVWADVKANKALHPQPSGETREQVARLEERLNARQMKAKEEAWNLVPQGQMAKWIEDSLSSATVEVSYTDLLALIRPAPVASGGQQGVGGAEQ